MRVVLADLRGREGFVSKDSVAGGYGSRLRPFSRTSGVITNLKRWFNAMPSGQLAYVAALLARAGHEVVFVRDGLADADLALVLTSLVDHRQESAWAEEMRHRGARVGALGLAASKLPELFEASMDFVVSGEPEHAVMRLAAGERLTGRVESPPIQDLDELPFPRWDLVGGRRGWHLERFIDRPVGGGFPLVASRGCPEFCTYCPHRILAGYRARSVGNVADELAELCERHVRPFVVFRDPLFTLDRDRMLALVDEIARRRLRFRFECETRLDRLDPELLDRLHEAGLRAITFGVESVSMDTLRRVGRRPTPPDHQRLVIDHCRRLGIATGGFYVLGFLQDNWESIAATIQFSVDLTSTFAQFKLLTPYPGTPLWKQLGPLVFERNWERFDGFTPTFNHPSLTTEELQFLLGAAYTRFYMRPSFLTTYWRVRDGRARRFAHGMDRRVTDHHSRQERLRMRRAVTC